MKTPFRYLEDYEVGQKGVTLTRTVTEADIVNYGGLEGNYSWEHMDRHYMAKSIYGERVAHGILGCSLMTGMLSLTAPHIIGRSVPGAYFQSYDVNYRGPIKVGDTVKIQWSIAEKADDRYHEGYGVVMTVYQVVNHEGVTVYNGTLATLVRKKSAGDIKLQLKPTKPWVVEEYDLNPGQVCCLEDMPLGRGGESEGRTVTEADIVRFAGITGDYNPQYVDAEYAGGSQFGERIAHGMLVLAIANGLRGTASGRDQTRRSNLAGHVGDTVSFLAPVKIGDTIRCRYKVVVNRVSRSKPELGILTYGGQALNQRNEGVMEYTIALMIPTREGLRKQGLV